jgi:triosephosphate isomerase
MLEGTFMRRSIIAGNWKMYAVSIADANILATTIRNNVAKIPNVETILCPPTIWLSEVAQIIKKAPTIKLGAQNVCEEAEGAFTGETSVLMVKEVADYTIVGHSERRGIYGETNLDVNDKTLLALKAGLTPIICVGEKKKSAKSAQPISELKSALDGIPKKYYKNIIIAYEPVWAIGTGLNADAEYAAKVITRLREFVHADTPILYGGSVKSGNIAEYAKRPEIDGVLVGGASVRAAEFVKICKIWSETKDIK